MNDPTASAVELGSMRVAVVHDWLYVYGGAERVLEQILHCFPGAHLFSLIDFLPQTERRFLRDKRVTTSFIQRLPFARRMYQKYLPLMPAAIEALDLRGYDLVLSSSSAVAKGVLTEPHQLHVCYLQSRNNRYTYEERFAYSPGGMLGAMQEVLLSRVRVWDAVAAKRPDVTFANSEFVARWHAHRHGIQAKVIYPPVALDLFNACFSKDKDDYFVLVSRFEAYKQVPVVVEAFNRLGRRLLVIGGGSREQEIKRLAKANVEFLGMQPADRVARIVSRARAFVFAGREDFGIAVVEAQACGTPVVVFRGGAAREIVRGLDSDAPTGVLFDEQTVDAVLEGVRTFERHQGEFDPEKARENARRFSTERFRREYVAEVTAAVCARSARVDVG